jgi:hypothetical protein
MGGVHRDERPGTGFPGWLYARHDGGVTWMRHTKIRPRKPGGYVTA